MSELLYYYYKILPQSIYKIFLAIKPCLKLRHFYDFSIKPVFYMPNNLEISFSFLINMKKYKVLMNVRKLNIYYFTDYIISLKLLNN